MTKQHLTAPRVSIEVPHQRISTTPRAPKAKKQLINFAIFLVFSVFFIAAYSPGKSFLFLISTFCLSTSIGFFILLYKPHETLSPVKITSLLYLACFGYGPLWLADEGIYSASYYGSNVEELMGNAALIALAGYIFFLMGYFTLLTIKRSRAKDIKFGTFEINARQKRYLTICAMIVGFAGSLSYIVLVARSGGIGYLMQFSGSRADIFIGVYGAWFWGMHLIFPAYGLFALIFIKKHPWVCLLLALLIAAAFVPFQGRDIVVAPLFCWLLFFHTLRTRLRWKAVILGAFTIILVSAVVAALFREGGNKVAASSTNAFFSFFMENVNRYLVNVVSLNIEQLDSAMIAVRFVETAHKFLGPWVLTTWLEPIDRLFLGDMIPSIQAGVFMDNLVMPEHRGWNTAISPSILGELYIGLGWLGIWGGMFLYGNLVGMITVWQQRCNKWPVLFAAYPFVVYMVAKVVVDGSVHLFRPLIAFAAVMVLIPFTPRKAT